jgi:hypothetical protein
MVEDIAGLAHLNPNLLRYETHRVWVVEATLRIGLQHRYAKRHYYFVQDIDNDRAATYNYSVEHSIRDFTTSSVRREAKR